MSNKKFLAIGFASTETHVYKNGSIQTFLSDSRKDAIQSWLYVHRLHNRDAYITPYDVGICPLHGRYVFAQDLTGGK